ncbi:MAG TPA: class D beta-lactamase [Kofleriaceae bacterium]|nr:class D beta-lactamase [Kofleriaceae bacterium]
MLAVAIGCGAPGQALRVEPGLQRPIEAAGVRGVIVLFDPQSGALQTNDVAEAQARHLPASTFKIFNSLVALEEKAVADEHEVIEWDGVERPIAEWNRDHDMASAIKVSAVWFYQELARRVGAVRMQHWLDAVGYGNRVIAPAIDEFWIRAGGLRISALEQVRFVDRLRRGDLPFSPRTMDIVRRITIVDQAGGAVLHAKTGWGIETTPDIGWYVGWVEKDGRALVFALRIEMRGEQDLGLRAGIVRQVLARRGWMPEPGGDAP